MYRLRGGITEEVIITVGKVCPQLKVVVEEIHKGLWKERERERERERETNLVAPLTVFVFCSFDFSCFGSKCL